MYILKGFPTTETDAAQFLEENNAFYSAPHKKHKGAGPPPPAEKPGDKPAFLSALDAVIQITTRWGKSNVRVSQSGKTVR